MKEVVLVESKIKEIKVTVFVARDGKEFSSEEECSEYEAWLESEEEYNSAKEHISHLKEDKKKDCFPFIPLDIFIKNNGDMTRIKSSMRRLMDDAEYYNLSCKDDAFALAVVMAHDICADISPEKILKHSGKLEFPCTVFVSSSYGWGRKMGTFENETALIRKYCKLHGYDIKIEKD